MEALFAELKNEIGLRRLRLRRLKFVREQFILVAAAQNIKRLGSLPQPRSEVDNDHNNLVATKNSRNCSTHRRGKIFSDCPFFNTHTLQLCLILCMRM